MSQKVPFPQAIAGPSQPSHSFASSNVTRARVTSTDFGDFASAQTPYSRGDTPQLDEDDLLGSFEDLTDNEAAPYRLAENLAKPGRQPDLLGEDIWDDGTTVTTNRETSSGALKSKTVHAFLPPRPSEIDPNYIPHSAPRRMSHGYSFPGPSSPPLVTTSGKDIIYHPSHEPQDHSDAIEGMRRIRQQSFNHSPLQAGQSTGSARPNSDNEVTFEHHSSLLNTLATTTKLASKWRTVISPSTTTTPTSFQSPDYEMRRGTALPIDITHSTPFASAEQIAGSYIPPTGAPGLASSNGKIAEDHHDGEETDFPSVNLLGRRDITTPVLTESDANQLRKSLPPRQRLSGSWTLIFSLDQHGASLATLYRLVEKYTVAHRTAGNILVVRDAQGHAFGVYMNEAIVKRDGSYYGTGESFLFKLPVHGIGRPKVFRWTGKNQYFALCESGFISFGGGGGSYGLLLDSSFSQNSSATSPAYDNEILCDAGSRMSDQATSFECLGLELWGTI